MARTPPQIAVAKQDHKSMIGPTSAPNCGHQLDIARTHRPHRVKQEHDAAEK